MRRIARALVVVIGFLGVTVVTAPLAQAGPTPPSGCTANSSVMTYQKGTGPWSSEPWDFAANAWGTSTDVAVIESTTGGYTQFWLWWWNDGNTGLYGLAAPCPYSGHVWPVFPGGSTPDARMNRYYADAGTKTKNFYHTTAVHELGHLIGLSHNNTSTACSTTSVIYSDPNVPYNCSIYTPRSNDIAAVNSIY